MMALKWGEGGLDSRFSSQTCLLFQDKIFVLLQAFMNQPNTSRSKTICLFNPLPWPPLYMLIAHADHRTWEIDPKVFPIVRSYCFCSVITANNLANTALITGRSHRKSLWWQFRQINSQCFSAGKLCAFKVLLLEFVSKVTVKSCKYKQTLI